MTDAMKAKLDALSKKAEAELTAAEKGELEYLNELKKQETRLSEHESMIGRHATTIGTLKAELAAAKAEDKAGIQAKLDEKQALVDMMNMGLGVMKDAIASLSTAKKFSTQAPGDGGTVDPKTIEALEDRVLATKGGKEAVEAAYQSMTDEEVEKMESDPAFRKRIFELALKKVGGDETVRSPWRKVPENKGTPPDGESRLEELFGLKQKQARFVPGSSGRGGRGGSGQGAPTERTERPVDTRSN